MSDLAALLERVKTATGPDRELDAAIIAALNNAIIKPYPPTDDFGPHDRWQFWSRDGQHFLGSEHKFKVPPLTASIDAALALVEKMLYRITNMQAYTPDLGETWYWSVDIWHDKTLLHGARRSEDYRPASLPLSIITALLTALIEKEQLDYQFSPQD